MPPHPSRLAVILAGCCGRQCQHGHEAQAVCPNSVLEGGFQRAALAAKAVLDGTTVEITTIGVKKRSHEKRHSSAYLVADGPCAISWQCGRHSGGMGILVIVNASTQIITTRSSRNLTPFFLISRNLSGSCFQSDKKGGDHKTAARVVSGVQGCRQAALISFSGLPLMLTCLGLSASGISRCRKMVRMPSTNCASRTFIYSARRNILEKARLAIP